MRAKKVGNISVLTICMCVALFMTGGFFDHSVAMIGIVIIGCFLYMLKNREAFCRRDSRKVYMIPEIVLGISVLVSFWAIDYMENLMGVMRLGVACLWMFLLRCRDKKEIDMVKKLIPYMGCISIVISIVSLLVPALEVYFWENSRMSGFFQYANTNGLFFAIGIMLLVYQMKDKKKPVSEIVLIIILLAGLLLSGSRSVLLLLIGWGIYYAIREVTFRKPFLLGCAGGLLLGGLYVVITGNTANIGRIFTIFTSNSTLWGRLLYYRDAALVIIKQMFGLGRLGYYYSQGTFQSGVYYIKYVHNDFLQVALDYGIIAFALVLIFCGWQLWRGKQGRVNKEILGFMLLTALLDLHFQYLFILMIACLFLDYGECVKEKKTWKSSVGIVLLICLTAFSYIGIATWNSHNENYDVALSMLPDYTYAQEKKMLSVMGTSEAYELATRVIEKNPYNITAYVIRGSYLGTQLYVKECIADLDRMLELSPYNVGYYKQYEELLLKMKDALSAIEDENSRNDASAMIQKRLDSLPDQLAETVERTSWLAYKINDQPVFSYK